MIKVHNIVLIIILIILSLLICKLNNNEDFSVSNGVASKYKLWVYWETLPNRIKPPYIDLCMETIIYHCKDNWDIVLLDNRNINEYLPELRSDIDNLGLNLAQKTDYIRVMLLKKFGGLWLDADTIVMTDLSSVIDKLDEGWDYVGFGCTNYKCNNGYPRPSNGAMASPQNSRLMALCLNKLDGKLDKLGTNKEKIGYFDLGKLVIWEAISEFGKASNYKYYHYNSGADGSRDINENWINVDNHISYDDTEFLANTELLFVFLENNRFSGNDPKYNFFSKLSREEILDGKWWITRLFQQSLNLQ